MANWCLSLGSTEGLGQRTTVSPLLMDNNLTPTNGHFSMKPYVRLSRQMTREPVLVFEKDLTTSYRMKPDCGLNTVSLLLQSPICRHGHYRIVNPQCDGIQTPLTLTPVVIHACKCPKYGFDRLPC